MSGTQHLRIGTSALTAAGWPGTFHWTLRSASGSATVPMGVPGFPRIGWVRGRDEFLQT
jgi:hypothetical protein